MVKMKETPTNWKNKLHYISAIYIGTRHGEKKTIIHDFGILYFSDFSANSSDISDITDISDISANISDK